MGDKGRDLKYEGRRSTCRHFPGFGNPGSIRAARIVAVRQEQGDKPGGEPLSVACDSDAEHDFIRSESY